MLLGRVPEFWGVPRVSVRWAVVELTVLPPVLLLVAVSEAWALPGVPFMVAGPFFWLFLYRHCFKGNYLTVFVNGRLCFFHNCKALTLAFAICFVSAVVIRLLWCVLPGGHVPVGWELRL